MSFKNALNFVKPPWSGKWMLVLFFQRFKISQNGGGKTFIVKRPHLKFYKPPKGTCSIHCVNIKILSKCEYMEWSKQNLLYLPVIRKACFLAFLTCNAWNLHHIRLTLESYGQRDHKKSWNYIRRVTCKTSGPWFEARRNESWENELKMIIKVKFGGIRAQSRPLTTTHTLLSFGFLVCSMGIISVLIASRWEHFKVAYQQ